MKLLVGGCIFLIQMISVNFLFAQGAEGGFTKTNFYSAMSANNEDAVNNQLALLKKSTIADKTAYEGALLMKKAGITGRGQKKLNLFKEGHKKLEAILKKDSSNIEFRFLRFMIQEHAPGILGYKSNLQTDRAYIMNNFKKLPPALQEAVVNYSKASKILKPADL